MFSSSVSQPPSCLHQQDCERYPVDAQIVLIIWKPRLPFGSMPLTGEGGIEEEEKSAHFLPRSVRLTTEYVHIPTLYSIRFNIMVRRLISTLCDVEEEQLHRPNWRISFFRH